MVMENKHMVDRDGVGDDGDEEALEIPFSGVENRINQPPKMKIMVVAHSGSQKSSSYWEDRFWRYIRTCAEGEAEAATEAQTDPGGAAYFLAHATWSHLHPCSLLISHFISFCLS
jgi:hypothetical protein